MQEIQLNYWLSNYFAPNEVCEGLERIAKLSTNLKACKEYYESPQSKLGSDEVNIDVYLAGDSPMYVVTLESKSAVVLQRALESLIGQCGAPNFASGNYEMIEKILKPHGKRLKRRFNGLLVGKNVVNI